MATRWGLIGSGAIIPRFMGGFVQVKDAVAAAIYARNRSKAEFWAKEYGIPQVFDDIDAFIQEAKIDIAYVAVTNHVHLPFALKCLNAKIPVLCEKPMAPNRSQALQMIECAKRNDTFLAEGFWTRMFPVTQQALQWIREGRIGKTVSVNGVFSIRIEDEDARLFSPDMAGGALLDIGVYLISTTNFLLGSVPREIATVGCIGKQGVDTRSGVVLKYETGEIATFLTSIDSPGRDVLTVYGTEGMIEIFEEFWRPRRMKMTCRDGVVDFTCPSEPEDGIVRQDPSFQGEGYQFEIRHIQDCLKKGLRESPFITHRQSLDIIDTCDRIRAQWGLKFPFEGR